jgi:lambda family phage portal protein
VPLKLQVLESEHLDSSKDGVLANGNIIRSGIEFDKSGKRAAYYLFKEHPGESSLYAACNIMSVRIPASEILHIFKPLRPGQIRGEPWLSNVLLKLHDLDQYEDAELVRKKTAAMFAGFVTRLDPETDMFADQHDVGSDFHGLEPGTMQFLDPGEDVKFSSPADVGGTYEAFIKQQLRAISVGLGITYEQLTGDLSGVNYSSIRAGLVEFRRKCAALQHNLIVFQLCRPIWTRWIELAVLSDAVKILNDPTLSSVKWIPQGFAWVDPLKEQNAQMHAVRCGFKSRAEVVSELGYDIEEIDAEIAADNQRAKEMGLNFDVMQEGENDSKDAE